MLGCSLTFVGCVAACNSERTDGKNEAAGRTAPLAESSAPVDNPAQARASGWGAFRYAVLALSVCVAAACSDSKSKGGSPTGSTGLSAVPSSSAPALVPGSRAAIRDNSVAGPASGGTVLEVRALVSTLTTK